ncbi:MAG TPA: TonB-dependent receptor, partial [Chitinophagaceae bacterium]|nr:TonB-dependent receptor [Chitinophagaceae bacterium]
MRRSLLLLIFIGYSMICLSQNSATVSGRIIDKQSLEPIAGATVSAYRTNNATLTDYEGRFTLKNLKEGKSTLVISHVSYESEELSIVDRDNNKEIQVALTLANKIGNEVVVSASRRPEKITYAPANIYVINAGHLSEFAGSNVGELLSYIPAVEYLRSGVDQTNFNSRGFNNAFNNKTFQIVDGRNSMNVGSAGLPILNNGTTNKEDLERLEIVLGPQSALYGPNGLNTVLNYITKDPRKHSGTTVALTAGNQNQFSTRFRHAETLNKKFAYKLTGEYSAGTEFLFYDSVRAGGSVYGPAVSIPEHNVDFDFKHLRGEAHLYYTVNPKADIILSGGASNNDYFQMTTLGRNQMRDWRFGFLQARFVHKNLFLNVYNSWGDLGRSYGFHPYTRDFWNRTHSTITDPADPRYATMGRLSPDSAELFALRLGNMFKEHNQRSNAEAQYNYSIEKAGLTIVTGLAWQQDRPRSYGITLVDKDRRISVTQYGAVMQLQKTLPWQSKFIAAGRADNHSKFGTFFSPKIGIVTTIGDGSARLTWGRAFSMPSILAQSSGTGGVRFGNGDGISYIPNGAKVSDPASVQTTIPIKPEEVRTWELGYRGTIKKSLFVDV